MAEALTYCGAVDSIGPADAANVVAGGQRPLETAQQPPGGTSFYDFGTKKALTEAKPEEAIEKLTRFQYVLLVLLYVVSFSCHLCNSIVAPFLANHLEDHLNVKNITVGQLCGEMSLTLNRFQCRGE